MILCKPQKERKIGGVNSRSEINASAIAKVANEVGRKNFHQFLLRSRAITFQTIIFFFFLSRRCQFRRKERERKDQSVLLTRTRSSNMRQQIRTKLRYSLLLAYQERLPPLLPPPKEGFPTVVQSRRPRESRNPTIAAVSLALRPSTRPVVAQIKPTEISRDKPAQR